MPLVYCGAFRQGYEYIGAEYASECYCGNTLQLSSHLASIGDCNTMCGGGRAQVCGVDNRATVYENSTSVTPAPSSTSSLEASQPIVSAISHPVNNGTTVVSVGRSFVIERSERRSKSQEALGAGQE